MKVRENHCPYCGSTDITCDDFGLELGQQFYRHFYCEHCGREFEQWYELTFNGMNIGDELTTWVDKDQDI